MGRSAKWQGTVEPLLNILTKVAGERVANSREWPKKPKGLGGRLREAAPNLRKLGMNISFDRRGKRGTWIISVVQGAQSDKGEDASAASDAAANGANTDDINDMGRRTQGQTRASANRHNASATHNASAATSLKNNKADAADAAGAFLR
jgi:hypothetical protein